ncbi:MAG: hypothetical protein VX777_06785 [Chlamydiota bacterium]|nr:hypothetical protein [Chlamydiota bacterium]
MIVKVKKQHSNTSYHQNDSLLLQFVLSEFLLTYQETINLHTKYKELSTAYAEKKSKSEKITTLRQLIKITEKLTGASHNYMRIFSFHQDGGLLNKLNHYCSLFNRQSPNSLKEAHSIYSCVNASWLGCIQLHDCVLALEELPLSRWKEPLEEISVLERKIFWEMSQIPKLLPKLIGEYSNNENVIFFIVRHHHDFEKLISESFVKNLLNDLYDDGVNEAKSFLLRRYRRRGFEQLIPIISDKLHQYQ